MTALMNQHIESALQLVKQIQEIEVELDEVFFRSRTTSIAPPPVDFFSNDKNSDAQQLPIRYPDNFGQIIGQRIRQRRSQMGVTQNDLAEKTKIRRPNIARLEKGQSLPNLSTLIKVAIALEMSLETLLKV